MASAEEARSAGLSAGGSTQKLKIIKGFQNKRVGFLSDAAAQCQGPETHMQTLGKEVSQPPGFHKIDHSLRPVGNWAFVAAILLAAFYLATSLYISSHRLLW